MRILIVFLLSANCFSSQSQTIVKYYDAEWAPVEQDKAVYYANFVKEANQYKTTSYWVAGNVLRGKSTYADTSFNTPIGNQVLTPAKAHSKIRLFMQRVKQNICSTTIPIVS